MPIHVLRLGSPRLPNEGTRIGTVRRPPRGVPKAAFARENWYDVWFPNLAPSQELMQFGRAVESESEWLVFARGYKAEMENPAARHDIALLAALSHTASFSVGCYCENESRCHRSLLRSLLEAAGALIAPPSAPTTEPSLSEIGNRRRRSAR